MVYVGLALGAWAGVLSSGVHATVAGVLVAMLVPVRSRLDPHEFLDLTEDRLSRLRQARLTPDSVIEDRWQLDAISDLRRVASEMRPPGLALEETFHGFVAFVDPAAVRVLQRRRRAWTGASPTRSPTRSASGSSSGWSWARWWESRSSRGGGGWSGGPSGPKGSTGRRSTAGSCLAGIGFTMSMFVTQLAFSSPENLARAKVGILAASVAAAVLGAVVLHLRLPPRPSARPTDLYTGL